MNDTVPMLGYSISSGGLGRIVAQALRWMGERGQARYIACANPHSLVVAADDPAFARALLDADMLTPDGVGITVAARILGLPLTERVVGYDLFMTLSRLAARRGGLRYFFLGSSPEVLDRIVERMERDFPGIEVCGTYAPSFGDSFSPAENARMVEAVNRAEPDVLWVGMTAPKQEKWIHANRHLLRVPLVAAVGAVFDFYAGTKPRCPTFWQNAGLEWLYRLVREPRRLWERTVLSAPRFLAMVLRERLRPARPLAASPVARPKCGKRPC